MMSEPLGDTLRLASVPVSSRALRGAIIAVQNWATVRGYTNGSTMAMLQPLRANGIQQALRLLREAQQIDAENQNPDLPCPQAANALFKTAVVLLLVMAEGRSGMRALRACHTLLELKPDEDESPVLLAVRAVELDEHCPLAVRRLPDGRVIVAASAPQMSPYFYADESPAGKISRGRMRRWFANAEDAISACFHWEDYDE